MIEPLSSIKNIIALLHERLITRSIHLNWFIINC